MPSPLFCSSVSVSGGSPYIKIINAKQKTKPKNRKN